MKVGTDGVLLGTWIPTINNSNTLILDIGTGCGLIALILAQRIENSYIKAIDIDDGAIENAKRNFAESVWNDRLTAMEISIQRFCETSTEKFDIIVSNPPYIRTEEIAKLMPEVQNFEPYDALDGKEDGLFFYRKIVEQAGDYLNPGGHLLFEIGHDQGTDVSDLMVQAGFKDVRVIKDLAGNDRVVTGGL